MNKYQALVRINCQQVKTAVFADSQIHARLILQYQFGMNSLVSAPSLSEDEDALSVGEAIKTINTATTANPDMVKIIPKLENSGFELKWKALDGLVPSNPDKVLRRIKTKDGFHVLVPASSAIEIVLRHGLEKEPAIQELIQLLNQS